MLNEEQHGKHLKNLGELEQGADRLRELIEAGHAEQATGTLKAHLDRLEQTAKKVIATGRGKPDIDLPGSAGVPA
jgi:hypothetical protein